MWQERWGRVGNGVIIFVMALLFALPWAIFIQTIAYADQPMQHPVMFFPLPLFLLFTLYWVRWWATQPRQLLVEELRAYEDQI
jgi:hypothetical protein